MRKFSKLLTLVLVLSLVCGIVAVVASAAADNITVSGAGIYQYSYSTDFENPDLTNDTVKNLVKDRSVQIYGGEAPKDGDTADLGVEGGLIDNLTVVTQANGNKYINHRVEASEGKYYDGAWFAPIITRAQYTKPTAQESAMLNDFTVLDFDITADAYLENGKFTTDVENADSLSYTKTNINFTARYWIPGCAWYTNLQCMYILTDNKYDENGLLKWYISDGKGNEYQLSNTPGEWTHVTVVFDYDNTVVYTDGTTGKYDSAKKDSVQTLNIKNSKAYVYANGQYLFSFAPFGEKIQNTEKLTSDAASYVVDGVNYVENIFVDTFRFNTADYKKVDFSIGLDNIATHHYATGYAGDLATDFATGAPATLFGTTDVVFNGDYESPNGAVGTVNGTTYYTQNSFLAAVAPGSTVTLNSNTLIPYAPTGTFTITTNGYNFKLDGEAGYMMKETSTAGTYTVVPASESAYIIIDTTTGDVITYGADIDNLLTDYANLSAKNVKIVMNDDLVITSVNSACNFKVGGKSLELDLNGHKITQNTIAEKGNSNQTIPELFRFDSAGTLNVYSSKPGAELIVLSYKYSDNIRNPETDSGKGIENTAGIVYINNNFSSGEINVTIGNGKNNLTIYSTILLQSYSKVKTNINLRTVNYYAPSSNGRGHFMVRGSGAHTLNATGSTFAISAGTMFYVDLNCGFNATIDSCVFAAPTVAFASKVASQNATDLSNSKIVITDTDMVFANMDFLKGAEGCIVLGKGTRFNFDIPTTGYVVLTEGTVAKAYSGGKETTKYDMIHPVVNDTDAYNPVFTFTTPTLTVNAEYKYEVVIPPKQYTVTWATASGKTIAQETYYEGDIATFKGNVVSERIDNWFAKGIAGWENEEGETDNFKVSQNNNTFYAIDGIVVSPAALYNFRTDNNFTRLVYVPVPTEGSDIVVIGITDDHRLTSGAPTPIFTDKSRVKIVSIGGVEYYQINDTPGVSFDFDQNYTVTYTYKGEEYQYKVTAPCMAGYFAQVLEDKTQCDEAVALVVNSANYVKTVLDYTNKSNDIINKIVSDYSHLILTASATDIKADFDSVNYSDLMKVATGVSFIIGDGFTPSLAVAIPDYTTVVSGSFVSNSGNTAQFNLGHANYHYKGEDGFTAETSANFSNNYLRVMPTMGAYDARQTITIVIGEHTGTFNLGAYIYMMQNQTGLTDKQVKGLEVAKALYAYAEASLAYKTRSQAK